MEMHLSESTATSYLAGHLPALKAALEDMSPAEYPGIQSWPARMSGLQRSVQSVLHSLQNRRKHLPHPQ